MIKINIQSHSLGGNTVLENIDLEIPDGAVLGLVGTNGAGKSTLLRLMSGVYIPDLGEVSYDGRSVTDPSVRQNIFFLPDDPYYAGQSTGRGILGAYRTFYPNIDMELYRSLLRKFKLDDKKHQRNFSKGMRRQFYIALALSVRPQYLLLDEAFDGLDPFTKHAVIDEINRAVEENGMTVVLSSQALTEIETFCDAYALIDGKTVIGGGSLDENKVKYCRFKLAYTATPDRELFASLPVRALEISGKFVTITLEGDADELETRLNSTSPAVIERVNMSFEDIFITDVKGGIND